MEKVSNKSRRETIAQKEITKLTNAKKDLKMLPLLTDPISQLATNSTNRFVDQCIFANEQPLTSLDCLDVNAYDNGCLSFLDSIINANTVDETGVNLIKEQQSLFGENAFAEAIGEDGPSPFIGQEEQLMDFNREPLDLKKLDE